MKLLCFALALALALQYALHARRVARLRLALRTVTRERDALLRYALRVNQRAFLAKLREEAGA